MGKTHRLSKAWKRWRDNRREYQIQRALYKQGEPRQTRRPDLQWDDQLVRTHGTDASKLSDD